MANNELPIKRFDPKVLDREIIAGGNNQKPYQPYIMDLDSLERLVFQTVPLELDYNPEMNWVAVYAPGRNTPVYQYTGGEDTLNFSLTFYSDDSTRMDVIKKCKWLESLGRNNGYDKKPPLIQLAFGDLFRDAKWIVASAKPTYSLFNREYGMMPTRAVVEISLKRVEAHNRVRTNILKSTT